MPIFPLTFPDAVAAAELKLVRDPIKRLLADNQLEVGRIDGTMTIAWLLPCGHTASIEVDAYEPTSVLLAVRGGTMLEARCKCTTPAAVAAAVWARRPS